MADQTGKSDNNPKKPISEEEYKKGLISDIRPIQARPEKKDSLENLTGNSGDFADTEDIEDEEDQEIIDDESSEEEQDDQPELSRDDIERLTEDQRIKETPEQQLGKNKVPEYKAEPPEAYKKPPGGPAIKPTGTAAKAEQGVAKAGQGAAKTAQGAAQGAKNTAQAAAKAGQAAVKAIQATVAGIRNAVAAIGALFSSAPAWVPVVLIILGILIIVGAVVIFLKARSTPNANGASPTIAADVVNDHPLIQTVLALSNQQNMQEILAANKQKLIGELQSFKSEIQTRYPSDARTQDTITKIDRLIELVNQYNQPDVQKAKEIKDLLIAIAKPWSVTLNPGGFIFPASKFNASHPGSGSDYGACNSSRPQHRGIDRGLDIGTVYRAPTDAEIVYVLDKLRDYPKWVNLYSGPGKIIGRNQNGGFGNTIVGKVIGGTWDGHYWEIHHVKRGSASALGMQVGTMVSQGQMIGLSGHNGISSKPHIHFQVDKPNASSGGFPVGIGRERQTVDPYLALGWQRRSPCNF